MSNKFAFLVVDEAHLMANPDTDLGKALASWAREKILLTGTPLCNGY